MDQQHDHAEREQDLRPNEWYAHLNARKLRNYSSSTSDFDPNNTDRQRMMLWVWENYGVEQLKNYIVEIAAIEAEAEHAASQASSNPIHYKKQLISLRKQVNVANLAHSRSDAHKYHITTEELNDLEGKMFSVTDHLLVDPHEGSCAPFESRWPSQPVPASESKASLYVCPDVKFEPIGSEATSFSHSDEQLPMFERAHPSWQLILDDARCNDGRKIVSYLMQINPVVLSTFIKGNYPQVLMRDYDFEDFEVGRHRYPMHRQGTFARYIARDPNYERDTGKWPKGLPGTGLTPAELLRVYQDVKDYINLDHQTFRVEAKRIDHIPSLDDNEPQELDYRYQRRYGYGRLQNNFEHHKTWLKHIENRYLPWILNLPDDWYREEGSMYEPMDRCLAYVGSSWNSLHRTAEHWSNAEDSSLVFSLILAILGYRFPCQFSCDDKASTQVFLTVNPDDIGFDEVLTTILLSAYPWDGGLSTAYAGVNIGFGKELIQYPRYARRYRKSHREILYSDTFRAHRESTMAKRKALREAIGLPRAGALGSSIISRIMAEAEAANLNQRSIGRGSH